MAKKEQIIYVCQNCGRHEKKWLGRCPECGEFGTLTEERIIAKENKSREFTFRQSEPISYSEIESWDNERIQTGLEEFDRVLGGGIVKGSLVLIGGTPGIGKSTLTLQVADRLTQRGETVLYVSGEESAEQIKMRGERLKVTAEGLFILCETNLENILEQAERMRPDYIIVDSIQTVYSSRLESFPGSVGQVREAATSLMFHAKTKETTCFLIGHVTKEGLIAGPKTLEHIVDTVLYFEGDSYHNHRIIRAVKNRFGATNEIGVFEMTEFGLIPVPDPSRVFLQEKPENVSGSAITVCMEGTRPFLVEIQALVTETKENFKALGRRMTQGIDYNRAALLTAVLEKRFQLPLFREDIFINVAGGLQIEEPAVDLAVLVAIFSSYRNIPLPSDTVFFGEVGLAGEIRSVSQAEARVREAQKLGFRYVVLPAYNKKGLEKLLGLRLIGVKTLKEVLDRFF
ncbi:MAG: DNA repair protein RadA [Pyrinomonadaceae bacterium]|nr:MAG: DNA repair protein RadA [Pyrinomonadaceae bacterium]